MIRRLSAVAVLAAMAVVLALSLTACDGRRPPITEFDQGFNAGLHAVRDVRQKWGVLGDVAGQIGVIGPGDKNRSPDWNAGFRAGVKSELAR